MTRPRFRGRLEVPDGRIDYEVAGDGPGLVLLHAAIADLRMWDREIDRLAPDHRVVRFNFRGYGGSLPASAPFSRVRDLEAVVVHLGLDRPVIVGPSVGGRIAIDFALERPDAVGGLLLVAPGLSGFEAELEPAGAAAYAADERRSREVAAAWKAGDRATAIELLRTLWCPALTGAALDRFRQMVEENLDEVFDDRSERWDTLPDPPAARRLGGIDAPTTVLIGDRDNPVMGYFAEYIARQIPGAVRVKVPGGDHLLNLSRPDAFDAGLASLLGRVRRPAERAAGV